MHSASWQELHVLTRHWESDLDFYRHELDFLTKLINKYFMWLARDEHVSQVQATAARLLELQSSRHALASKMQHHLQHLEGLQNKPAAEDVAFREEHASLEDEFSAFVKSFRELKKTVFKMTEDIVEHEKLEHLLKN